jgi:hypothetical protein
MEDDKAYLRLVERQCKWLQIRLPHEGQGELAPSPS